MFKGKKATAGLEDSLLFLFDLIILSIAGAVLFTTVSNLVNNPLLEERTVAADLALYLDTLYAAPSPVMGLYAQQEFGFLATFEKGQYNKVVIKAESDATVQADYLFHPDAALTNSFTAFNTSKATVFVKQDSTMTSAPQGNVQFSSQLSFFAIPSITVPSNIHVYAANSNARQVQNDITTGVKIQLQSIAEQVTDAKSADMVLVLQTKEYDKNTLKLFIPPNSPQSRYLAGLIQQQLKKYPFSSIIPISPSFFAQDDPSQILRASIPSVLVSLPSAALDPLSTATAIDRAMQQYLHTPVMPVTNVKPNTRQVDNVNIIRPTGGQ